MAGSMDAHSPDIDAAGLYRNVSAPAARSPPSTETAAASPSLFKGRMATLMHLGGNNAGTHHDRGSTIELDPLGQGRFPEDAVLAGKNVSHSLHTFDEMQHAQLLSSFRFGLHHYRMHFPLFTIRETLQTLPTLVTAVRHLRAWAPWDPLGVLAWLLLPAPSLAVHDAGAHTALCLVVPRVTEREDGEGGHRSGRRRR